VRRDDEPLRDDGELAWNGSCNTLSVLHCLFVCSFALSACR
jgi:hypothetical protein